MRLSGSSLGVAAALVATASAQTYRRFGTCPTLGCVIPPDQQDFLAGQYFDIRVEVHAPVNGSEATNGIPDEEFTFTIARAGEDAKDASAYFESDEPELETWDFSYYEYVLGREEMFRGLELKVFTGTSSQKMQIPHLWSMWLPKPGDELLYTNLAIMLRRSTTTARPLLLTGTSGTLSKSARPRMSSCSLAMG